MYSCRVILTFTWESTDTRQPFPSHKTALSLRLPYLSLLSFYYLPLFWLCSYHLPPTCPHFSTPSPPPLCPSQWHRQRGAEEACYSAPSYAGLSGKDDGYSHWELWRQMVSGWWNMRYSNLYHSNSLIWLLSLSINGQHLESRNFLQHPNST